MQFKDGADVIDTQGEKVGTLDRVVIDPQNDRVSHIVVRQGWLLPEDKVVPVEQIVSSADDQVVLQDGVDFDELPPFEETYYIPWEYDTGTASVPGSARPLAWYPPAGAPWWGYPAYAGYYGYAPYVTPQAVERNIPEGSVPLKEGAEVISADGESVGSVKRIFADSDTSRVTHFVISEGLFFKEQKLVPTAWVKAIEEDQVRLSVKANVLDRLEGYRD